MTGAKWLGTALVLLVAVPDASATLGMRHRLDEVNAHLHGQIIDYTHNHGADNRIWSPALKQWRDLYVYLPPGFDPGQCYPVILWFHGIAQDEFSFLDPVAPLFDEAIACGRLAPVIIVAPDGSLNGRPSWNNAGSFFINSRAGNFEDFVMQDVWGFVLHNYPIRPEREAHVLAGVSMGGFGAYNLGIKHRDCFKVVLGIFPPVNLRWMDCHCHYRSKFDPCCWAWRTKICPNEVIARIYCGLYPVRLKHLIGPLFDEHDPNVIAEVSQENPIEMLDHLHLCEGELSMYIGYAGKDEYHIDAQVESFLYAARQRGLCVTVEYDPNGKHDRPTAVKLTPGVIAWLAPQIAPFSPPLH